MATRKQQPTQEQPKKVAKRVSITASQVKKAAQLKDEGKSWKAIAEATGLTVIQVGKVLNSLGKVRSSEARQAKDSEIDARWLEAGKPPRTTRTQKDR